MFQSVGVAPVSVLGTEFSTWNLITLMKNGLRYIADTNLQFSDPNPRHNRSVVYVKTKLIEISIFLRVLNLGYFLRVKKLGYVKWKYIIFVLVSLSHVLGFTVDYNSKNITRFVT